MDIVLRLLRFALVVFGFGEGVYTNMRVSVWWSPKTRLPEGQQRRPWSRDTGVNDVPIY